MSTPRAFSLGITLRVEAGGACRVRLDVRSTPHDVGALVVDHDALQRLQDAARELLASARVMPIATESRGRR